MICRVFAIPRLILPTITVLFLICALAGCGEDDPFIPQPDGDISGFVLQPGGARAPGATVYLGIDHGFFATASTIVVDSTQADQWGAYHFDDLAPGRFQVFSGIWSRTGGYSLVSPFSKKFQMPDKDAGFTADLQLWGPVFNGAVAGDGLYFDGPDMVPADVSEVYLHRYLGPETLNVQITYSDLKGKYTFAGVLTGNYTVVMRKIFADEEHGPFPTFIAAESEAFFCNGQNLTTVPTLILREVAVEKPAVYIYPEAAGRFQVRLDLAEGVRLTASEPEYGGGWDVQVAESGRIDNRWDYLFYEMAMPAAPLIAEGWCLGWNELAARLGEIVGGLGLNEAETADFLGYWLARLPRRDFYTVTAAIGDDLDYFVGLDVVPPADSVLRLWLFFSGSSRAVPMTAPAPVPFVRTGTTVVEWGGALLR